MLLGGLCYLKHLNKNAMASSIPWSQPRVSVAGDTFSSVGRVLKNISAGVALGTSLTLASQLGGALAPAKAAVIVQTPLLPLTYTFSLRDNEIQYGTYTKFPSTDPTFRINVVIDGTPTNAENIFDPGNFASWMSATSSRQGFAIDIMNPSLEPIGLVFLDDGDGDFTIQLASLPGGSYELINPTTGDALFAFSYANADPVSGPTDANLDGDNNEDTGLWEYKGNGLGRYYGDPSGTLVFTVPVVDSSTGSASVPGPLPILGLAAAFGFSRKLRKRIKLHKDTSAVSTSPGA